MIRVAGFPAAHGLAALEVGDGEVVRLAGPNGAGKTTLLRGLAGLGAVRLAATAHADGPVGWAPAEPVQALCGLTVAGEFRLRRQAVPADLASLARRQSTQLSRGEARRVSLGLALAGAPRSILLDEPATDLDAPGVACLAEAIRDAARRGAAVLLCDAAGPLPRALAAAVDRTVAWPAPEAGAPRPALAAVPAGPLLEVPARTVATAGGVLRLPGARLAPGLTALVGPNGAGKSTWLLHAAGLHGDGARLGGRPLAPGRDVRLLAAHGRQAWMQATVAGELSGLPEVPAGLVPAGLMARHPLGLSAGEARRVALAQAVGAPAPVVLLDEPECHLDPQGRAVLWDVLARLAGRGCHVVAATHDPQLIAAAHHRVEVG